MKSRLILYVALFSLARPVLAAELPKLEVRRFVVHATYATMIGQTGTEKWKEFFGRLGVEWPEGSSIQFFPTFDRLVVKNTQENLRLVEELLAANTMIPLLIEVQIDFIEFKMEDVEKLTRVGELSASSLLALWRKGDAKLLYTPRVMTKSGCQATVKGVTEYIYPTDFEVASPTTTNAPHPIVTSAVVEPSGFKTREVGVILSCMPELSSDGTMINVVLQPETVYTPTWKNYGNRREGAIGQNQQLPMEQPFFRTQMLATEVLVRAGATVMIAGGMSNEAGDKTVFAFMTARLVDMKGNPIKTEIETGEQEN